jgi:hypothetical protein
MQQFAHVYLVFDALDEFTQRPELMDILKTVAEWELGNVHLLVTSRKEWDIENSLRTYVQEQEIVNLRRDVVDRDILRYVRLRLSDDTGLAKWNKDAATRQDIENTLMCGAHGMYVCSLEPLYSYS